MWKNLVPKLVRQRVIVEGTTAKAINPKQIKDYLSKLAKVTKMEVIHGPHTYSADAHGWAGGWAGYVHWKTSGAQFYGYTSNPPLFTVDCYTCKPFNVKKMVAFTKKYFSAKEIVWKEVKV